MKKVSRIKIIIIFSLVTLVVLCSVWFLCELKRAAEKEEDVVSEDLKNETASLISENDLSNIPEEERDPNLIYFSTGEAGERSKRIYPFVEDNDFKSPEISLAEAGIRQESIDMIEDIIEKDIEYGFPSAQLSIMRHGKLVYANAWGKTDSYNPDGSVKEDSPKVTVNTLYDLASITKMFAVNYALQKMVTDGDISLDAKVTDFLGDRFADDVIYVDYAKGDDPDVEVQKQWKRELTIRELLKHQGGFPADPRYFNPHINTETQEFDINRTNRLFAGNGADEATKQATIEAICKTPLLYEPGTRTVYSDVDYMILGSIVEQVSGMDLDTYIKKTFTEPMGLKHITFNPLDNGYGTDNCAATELNGNTRDHIIAFEGIRTYTIQGEVHDEKAFYNMGGVSGHAGLFGNATDLAYLADVMFDGKSGDTVFFSEDVIGEFTAPKDADHSNWGLGWWRQGNMVRTKYFGTKAGSTTIGHQGWTGTLVMIDPEKEMVIVLLTNKINSPVTAKKNPNKFDGNWYTTATLGFVPELLYIGLDSNEDVSEELEDAVRTMATTSLSAVKEGMEDNHPAVLNFNSKLDVLSMHEIPLEKPEEEEDETAESRENDQSEE